MMIFLRILASTACVLFLTVLSTSEIQAQLCGRSFAKFTVADSEGKSVPDATIELVAELPSKDYKEFKVKKGYEEYGYFSFKLSPQDAEELLKRGIPLSMSTDVCGNPLKQQADSTRVKDLTSFMNGSEASIKNFGYCASEGNNSITLLKISAPGYVTDHYVGSYLRGCFYEYSFVLSKVEKRGR